MNKKRHLRFGVYTWAGAEAACAIFAMFSAFKLTPASISNAGASHVSFWHACTLYTIALVTTSHVFGLHNNLNLGSRWRSVMLTLASVAIAIGVSSFVISTVFYQQIGRYILVICSVVSLVVCVALRLLVRWRVSINPHWICVLGSEALESYLLRVISGGFNGMLIHTSIETTGSTNIEIVVDDSQELSEAEIALLLSKAESGVQVSTATSFIERHFYRIPCQFVTTKWLFSIDFRRQHPFYNDFKRLSDVFLAITGLILSLPLLLAAIVMIRLEERGPVFYSQIRVGLYQKPFRIWKLRTMRRASEKGGAQWAQIGDPRITRMGRILRKTRLDEIPQFWNILCGDMALVGPRPERPEFVKLLEEKIPFYRERHLIKPGLTGWAQISYPYGAGEEDAREKLGFDFYYLKNASLMLDIQIILQTVGAIAKGAR